MSLQSEFTINLRPGPYSSENPGVQACKPDSTRVISFGQESLWYLNQLIPSNPSYNVPFASRLHGDLRVDALRRALDQVVGRHEVLRTAILSRQGTPVPFVRKKWAVELKQIRLSDLARPELEQETQQILRRESARPFDLASDLMLRTVLIQLADQEYVFLHVAPHIAFEGGSVGVFYRDLAAFYNAFISDQIPQLPPLPFQYGDYAREQRRSLQGARHASLAKYWTQHLTGAPLVNLPTDFPRPAVQSTRGKKSFFKIPPELVSTAGTFFRGIGTSPFRGLFTAFNILLHCYSQMTDISVGSPCGSRCRGIGDLIGYFVNTVVLRTNISDNPTFYQLIRRVDVTMHGAIAHSDLPFDKVVETLQPPRDRSRTPLFQVNFRATQQPLPFLQLNGITAGPPEYVDNGTVKFDLALEIESSTGKDCYFEYCTDLFTEQTIVQMKSDFQDLLRGLIAEPETPFREVKVVAEISQRIRNRTRGLRR